MLLAIFECYCCLILGHVAIPLIQLVFQLPFSIDAASRLINDSSPSTMLLHLQAARPVVLIFVTTVVLRIHGSQQVQDYISCYCCCGWRRSVKVTIGNCHRPLLSYQNGSRFANFLSFNYLLIIISTF